MADGLEVEDPDIVFAQHLIECELCTNAVTLYCSICDVNLCGDCIGHHINAKAALPHNVVSFKLRASKTILPHCANHVVEKCDLFCSKCDVPICVNCITLQHKAHPAIKLEDKCKQKKLEIEKESEYFEKNTCKNLENAIAKLQQKLEDVEKKYNEMQNAVVQKGIILHNEVDRTVQKFSEEINDMKNRDVFLIEEKIQENKGLLRALNVHLKQIKKLANSFILQDILEFQIRNNAEKCISFDFSLSMPSFASTRIKENTMYGTFGNLSSKITQNLKAFAAKQERVRTICSRSVICKSMETNFDDICNLACMNNNTLWINCDNKTMVCLKDTGVGIRKVDTESGLRPTNLAMTRLGDLIYAVYDPRYSSVSMVTGRKTEKVIKFVDWKPVGVCCTLADEFLVSMESNDETQVKIARFSGSTITQEIQYDDKHRPLYAPGKYYILLEENKNLDVCASDPNKNEVVVTDKDGVLRWKYKGNLKSGKFESFSPSFIISDSHCQLLVMDTDNNCVHLLDMDGIFIGYIMHPKIHGIGAMSLDRNGRLWIANYKGGQINVFKYLQ